MILKIPMRFDFTFLNVHFVTFGPLVLKQCILQNNIVLVLLWCVTADGYPTAHKTFTTWYKRCRD